MFIQVVEFLLQYYNWHVLELKLICVIFQITKLINVLCDPNQLETPINLGKKNCRQHQHEYFAVPELVLLKIHIENIYVQYPSNTSPWREREQKCQDISCLTPF